jgi:hypothetical protein
MNTRITPQLLDVLREEIRLDWHGFHGVSRRARVRDNGLHFMAKTCADIAVLEYFDLLHDVARNDDYEDSGHGARAAKFVLGLPHEVRVLPRFCGHFREARYWAKGVSLWSREGSTARSSSAVLWSRLNNLA